MAQQRGKWMGSPHPAVAFVAAGLLIGVTFNDMIRSAARVPLAAPPQEARSTDAGRLPMGLSPALPLIGPLAPAPPSGAREPGKPGADPFAPPLALNTPVKLPPALLGPPVPVRGPEWMRAPLPAFSHEVLQAMMDPRAARRARHLRRLGIIPPPEPAPPVEARTGAPGVRVAAQPERPAGAARGERRAQTGKEMPAGPAVAPAPKSAPPPLPEHKVKIAAVPPVAPPGTGEGATGRQGEGATGRQGEGTTVRKGVVDAARGTAAPPAGSDAAPIRLQARMDRSRPEYRVGEWVALRFLASQPVHLRVYRVDAAGQVTRVFSTYGRADSGQPARTFSMMVKAGEPRPGQEGVVAIGSVRPLTRDELLACLRNSLAEGPAESAAPAATDPSASPKASPPAGDAPLTADPLKAVIDAVGHAVDTPEAAAAPLERSSWCIAIGRFVSAGSKLSAAGSQRSGEPHSGRS